jgi:hypothetical protein
LTSSYPKTVIKAKCGSGANIPLFSPVENKPSQASLQLWHSSDFDETTKREILFQLGKGNGWVLQIGDNSEAEASQ